ncbi:MAG: TRAP transporter substrate-binding protein DctP [Alphaproteobacteria bacterium]
MQDRMNVVMVAGLAAGLLFAAPVAAPAQTVDGPVVSWDMALFGTSRGGSRVFDETAKMVSEATGGKFTIKLHYGETLSPAKEFLDGLSIGAFQSAWVTPSYTPGRQPGVGGLDLPVLPVNSMKALMELQHNYLLLPELEGDFKRWNTKYIAPCTLPLYEFIGKGTPIQTVNDFKGKRLRALGGLGDVMRAVGAAPNSLPSPELYGALDRGLLDGMAFPFYAVASFKLHEISQWYTKGFAFPSPISFLAVGSKPFDALPPQYQKLLIEAGPKAARIQIEGLDEIEAKSEAQFIARGVKTIAIAPATREELIQRTSQAVFDKWVKEVTAQGYPGQKLLDYLITQSKKLSS